MYLNDLFLPLDISLNTALFFRSTEFTEAKIWAMDEESQKMTERKINYVPGLYKIFDEILVNASDNKQRDSTMNMIKVVLGGLWCVRLQGTWFCCPQKRG